VPEAKPFLRTRPSLRPCIGTLLLMGLPLGALPWRQGAGSHVPHKSLELVSRRLHAGRRSECGSHGVFEIPAPLRHWAPSGEPRARRTEDLTLRTLFYGAAARLRFHAAKTRSCTCRMRMHARKHIDRRPVEVVASLPYSAMTKLPPRTADGMSRSPARQS